MLLACEGLFFIAGLVAIIVGKFRLYGKRTVQGTRARIIGLILMLPGPLALCMGFVVGANGGVTQETISTLTGFEVLLVAGAFVTALILTLTTPETPDLAPYPAGSYMAVRSPGEDPVQKLKSLKEMLDSSLVTPQEYETKKAEILSHLSAPAVNQLPEPAIDQPYSQPQNYVMSQNIPAPASPPKKNNTVLIIAVVIVVLLCICLALVAGYILLQSRVQDVFDKIQSSLETFIFPSNFTYAATLLRNLI